MGWWGNITGGYTVTEKREVGLRRRHAERVSEFYGRLREPKIGSGRAPSEALRHALHRVSAL